ncbi:MAG: hypothetical protein JWO71_1484 [Candidatus Acidoferrum typicum]|nr:hypothetical protein [Candidatus Acidoferrum typicum]
MMTKLEVLLQSPDVPAGSFAAKPKVIYRAGNRYCRIEEQPDAERGIQGLLIVNEPDYWMANLLTKTAQHGVDSGPTFVCHMPMFVDGDKPAEGAADGLGNLEFGLEFEYFKGRKAAAQKGPILQGKQTTSYPVKVGTAAFSLFTYGTPERPLAVARVQGDKNEIYWYSGYGHVPFDPRLFAKPTGLKIEESKSQ